MGRTRGRTLAGIAVAMLGLAAPASAQTPAPAPAPAPTPVTPGTAYGGEIAQRHQVLRYELEAPETSVLRVHVAHTNGRCEIWATLIDNTAGSIVQNYVPGDGVDIEALVVDSGRYELAIDTGPIRACTGATFALSAEYVPLALSRPRVRARARSTCDEVCMNLQCLYYCQRIATLNTLIRKLHHKLNVTQGPTRAAALRQLHRTKRARRRAARQQRIYCLR